MQPHQHATRRRRIVATVVGAAAAVALVAGSVGPAAAAPRPSGVAGNHHSPAVAALAVSALEARDVYAWTGEAGAYQTYLGRLQVTADAVATSENVASPSTAGGFDEQSSFLSFETAQTPCAPELIRLTDGQEAPAGRRVDQ